MSLLFNTLSSFVHSFFPKASLIAQLVRICLQCRRPWFDSWVGKIRWRRDRLPTPVFLAADLGSIPGLGRSPGEEKGYPLQYSGLENSMDYIVHGVTKNRTWLSDFHCHPHIILHDRYVISRLANTNLMKLQRYPRCLCISYHHHYHQKNI